MNQDNNFNQNNYNSQGNNGISNNQPLNSQSFNYGMSVNQQKAPSFQQPIMQESTSQLTNNTFENGNASNQSFNSKSPKKLDLGLIIGIVAVVAVVGIGIVFGSKLFLSDNEDSDSNNLNNNSHSNSTIKGEYKKISLDKIGEYNINNYFKREQMTPIQVDSIGKINFGQGDLYQTLDFTNSDLHPIKFEYNSFSLGGNTSMSIRSGNDFSMYSNNYQRLDASEYENIVTGFKLNLFYQPDSETSYYHLIASKDEYYWSISSSFKSNPTYSNYNESEAKENIKKMLKLIQSEYDETAPTVVEFIAKIPTKIDFSFVSFDFNHEDIKINTYTVKFNDEEEFQLYDMEFGQDISYKNGKLILGVSYVENVANSISTTEVKTRTKTLYELKISNRNMRAYLDENNNLAYLGFVNEQNEYIIPANTKDLTFEEILELLDLIIK